MPKYTVTLSRSAQKFIDNAPRHMRQRLQDACDLLGRDPRPSGCVKMEGFHNVWRIREGDYRIQYYIFDTDLIVDVIKVDHRKDAYR